MIKRLHIAGKRFFRYTLTTIILLFWAQALFGVSDSLTDKENHYKHLDGYFKNSYLGLGVGKNFPALKTKESFTSGASHYTFNFIHIHNHTWMLGLSANFKRFLPKDREQFDYEELSLWSISHNSLRLVRIYHPLYLTAGIKTIYLLPTSVAKFPLQKIEGLEHEIGFAASFGFQYLSSSHTSVGIYIDRWRGTKTTKLQGIEIGLIFNVALY